ncbi:MAG: TIGR04255 family protein [Rhizobacter sp.]
MHYTRAPIAEAVIDLHVEFPREPEMSTLENYCRGLHDQFPNIQRINSLQLSMGLNEDHRLSSSSNASAVGFRLTSAKNDRVAQVRRNGVSYSHLAPYSDWEAFAAEARPFFSQFLRALDPSAVKRLAVRYINRIELPIHADLAQYFTVTPQIPPFCKAVDGYFLQLVLPQHDIDGDCKAVVSTGLENAVNESMFTLLDIDVFTMAELAVDESAIWAIYDKLRSRKNDLFEAIITDKTRSRIQ